MIIVLVTDLVIVSVASSVVVYSVLDSVWVEDEDSSLISPLVASLVVFSVS